MREANARATDLRRVRRSESVPWRTCPVSLLKDFGERENDESERIEERVHRHRNENRSTPLIGESETGSEDEERSERRQMRVHRGEKQRVENDAEGGAEITLEHAVEEETENEFLGRGGNGDGQDDDHDPLLESVRFIEKIDNSLFARASAEKTLSERFAQSDQWISRQQQNRACARCAKKTDSGKST